jgi:HK97 family phage major capsid protein
MSETGNPDYGSAFAKLLLYGEQSARMQFIDAERESFDRVVSLKGEQRAMSSTDTAGGYFVPFELDPTVLTSSGSINSLLSVSRVINTVSDLWHVVSSAGVAASAANRVQILPRPPSSQVLSSCCGQKYSGAPAIM